MNCLHGFIRQDLLDKYREVCTKHGAQRLSFPEDTTVKFKSIAKQQRAPFCIYADFECCTVKQEGDKYQHHEPNSFAYKVVSEYVQCDPVLYRGDNLVETFFDHMNKERDRIVKRLEKTESIVMTPGTITEQKREDYISSQTFTTYNQTDIDMDLPTAYKDLFTKFDEQERQGSGWYLSKIIHIEVHTATLSPLAASSYIELPKKVKRTEAVINIKNEDNMCFIWSVLAHLHPMDMHANRVNKYQPFLHELNGEGITFPTPIHQIPDFEKKNNVSINVFGWEEKEVVPVQLSRHDSETVINLLLISQDDKRHYCLIKNFSRLIRYRTKRMCKMFYCMNCLHGFIRQDLLDKHREVCTKHGAQRLSFPEDTAVKFKSIAKQQRAPFCIYADFECCTVKQEGDKYQHHEPNSFAYKVVSKYEQCDPVLYRGDNLVETFFDHMNKERDRIVKRLEKTEPIVMTPGTITEQKREDYISSQTFTTYNQTDIDMDLPTAYKDLFTKFDEQERQGSGWYLSKIIRIEVHTATLSPLAASSYIELPKKVKRTEAVINIKNEDNMCFIWSVLAHLHPMDMHANRVNKYQPFLHELNGEGITFPTPIHQIPDFEKKNNVSINVFGWEEKEVVPVQLSRHDSETVINLLLISQDDKRHYCLIKNFSRLIRYRTKRKCKMFYCMNCLHGFIRQDLLDKYREVCTKHGAQRLSFPEDTTVKFKSIAKQQRAPFCIYADFECCTVKQEGDKYQHHEPNSFAYKVVSEYVQCDPVLYRGDNLVETFFDHMNKERDRIVKRLEKTEPIVMTPGTITEQKREDYISSQTFTTYNQTDIDMDLPTAYKDLFTKFDEQERQGSGWYLSKIIHIEVHTATLSPLAASSYIELPKKVKRTEAVINIKNEDNMCFIWSVLAHLHPMTENQTE